VAQYSSFSLAPEEKLVRYANKNQQLYIGVPKEKSFQEKRISLTPESVTILTNNGHKVCVETKAGAGAHFTDNDYSEAGAQIVYHAHEVFKADIIVKSAPPSTDEIPYYTPRHVLISPIHLPTLTPKLIKSLSDKQITSLAFEYIKDESNAFPIVRSMSEIAGNQSIAIASELLSNINNGVGVMFGGISGVPPTKVVILGSGTVAEFAARAAIGMGANVMVFDNSIYKLKRLQNILGARLFTSVIYPGILLRELEHADVVIGAVHSQTARTPIMVTDEMVSNMKPGSVIIDVSIDQGGCFDTSEVTTHDRPVFKKYDVVHYCVPNIAARVARTASYAISSVITPILLHASKFLGIENLIKNDPISRHGVVMYKGAITNKHIAERFELRYTELDLLLGY